MNENSMNHGLAHSGESTKKGKLFHAWRKVKESMKWLFKSLLPPVWSVIKTLRLNKLWTVCRKIPSCCLKVFQSRDPSAPGAPDMANFNEVLRCWGIEEDEGSIKRIIMGLWMRCILSSTMAIIFLVLVLTQWTGRTSQVLALGSALFLLVVSLTTHIWRIRVLSTRKFILFKEWLKGRR